jgi:DeoR/GlpR family transcriptional regulator of sugar metabolism
VSFAKLVLQRASELIFVGDHTKFDNPALYKIADISELDYIATDEKPSAQWLSACRKNNIKLIHP